MATIPLGHDPSAAAQATAADTALEAAGTSRRGVWLIFALAFLAILAWKWETLLWPPYEDAALWLWMEASFLADSNFDYHSLWYEQQDPALVTGAVRAYMISAVPTLLAVLMRVFSDPRGPIVVYHLANFAAAAAIAAMLYHLLAKEIGRAVAVLIALAVLTTPVFSAQIEMLGLDLVMTAFGLGSAFCLLRGRYLATALLATASFFTKATGSLLSMAACTWLFIQWMSQRDTAARKRLFLGLLVNGLALALQVALVLGSEMMEVDERWYPERKVEMTRLWSAPDWSPDVLLVFVLVLIASLMAALATWLGAARQRHDAWQWQRAWEGLRDGVARLREPLLGWIVIAGMLAAMINVIYIPRYVTLIVPFLYLIAGLIAARSPLLRRLIAPLLLVVIAVNLANAEGRFFTPLEELYGPQFTATNLVSPRASILQERSLEYRQDLRDTLEAFAMLEAEHAAQPIFADASYCVYLQTPRLGYVRRPLEVYDLSQSGLALEAFLKVTEPESGREAPLILSGGLTTFALGPPQESDTILFDDEQPIPLVVYEKGWSGEIPSREARREWFLKNLVPGCQLRSVDVFEQAMLTAVRSAELESALELSGAALEVRPDASQLWDERAEQLLRAGRYDEAHECCRQALRRDPLCLRTIALDEILRLLEESPVEGNSEFWGDVDQSLRKGDWATTARLLQIAAQEPSKLANFTALRLQRAVDLRMYRMGSLQWFLNRDHQDYPGGDLLGLAASLLVDSNANIESRLDAASGAANRPRADYWLGQRFLQRGDVERARQRLESALVGDPRLAEAHLQLARLEEQASGRAGAIQQLRIAIEIDPDYADAHNDLGALLAKEGKLAEARVSFQAALSAQPDHSLAASNLAALDRRDEIKSAEAEEGAAS